MLTLCFKCHSKIVIEMLKQATSGLGKKNIFMFNRVFRLPCRLYPNNNSNKKFEQ